MHEVLGGLEHVRARSQAVSQVAGTGTTPSESGGPAFSGQGERMRFQYGFTWLRVQYLGLNAVHVVVEDQAPCIVGGLQANSH